MFGHLLDWYHIYIYTYIHTYIHTYRHTDRQTDRQTDRHTHTHTHTHTYIHFPGLLPHNGILPRAELTLCPTLAFSCTGSVTAWHSSSGHQRQFAVSYKERNYGTHCRGGHLYSAGRPSRWASVHISSFMGYVYVCLCVILLCGSEHLKRPRVGSGSVSKWVIV